MIFPLVVDRRFVATCRLLAVILATASLLSPLAAQVLDLNGSRFDPQYLIKRLEPNGFPSLSPPSFRPIHDPAGGMTPAYLTDDDWCIVVGAGAGARIYPVPVMIWHEVANDRRPGTNRATCVTYCILTGSAVVFDENFGGGRKTDFGVSGYLYKSNLVMYDWQTRSLWPQLGLAAWSGKENKRTLPLAAFRFMRWSSARYLTGALVCNGSAALAAMRQRYGGAPMPQLASYPDDAAILSAVDPAVLADRRFGAKERFAYFPGSNRAVSFSGLSVRDHPLLKLVRQDGKLLSVEAAAAEPFITIYWFGLKSFYAGAVIDF